MYNLKNILLTMFHPKKRVRRILRGGFDDLEMCKTILQRVAVNLSGVMSMADTINYICDHRVSIARIGDGEFECIAGNSIPFQKHSISLQNRLLEVLGADPYNCLIGFQPYAGPNLDQITNYKQFTYADSCFAQIGRTLIEHTSSDRIYANAMISRTQAFQELGVVEVKRLWTDRDVVVVTGRGSAFSMDPRLFDNVRSVANIYGLSAHAFSRYEQLLTACLQFSEHHLFLLSLGPTATVLAYDLSHRGYQALDIGHVSNCFHEFIGERESPERESRKKNRY